MARLLIAAIIFVSGSFAAVACGNGLLLSLLFRAYPEAKSVVSADREARRDGRLAGPAWSTKDTVSLHEWRAQKTAATIRRLRQGAADLGTPVPSGESAYLFLIHEFRWIELKREAGGLSLVSREHGPDGDEIRIFTTRRVLDNLLDGNIDWRHAVNSNFIASRGSQSEITAWLAVLRELTGKEKGKTASLRPNQARP